MLFDKLSHVAFFFLSSWNRCGCCCWSCSVLAHKQITFSCWYSEPIILWVFQQNSIDEWFSCYSHCSFMPCCVWYVHLYMVQGNFKQKSKPFFSMHLPMRLFFNVSNMVNHRNFECLVELWGRFLSIQKENPTNFISYKPFCLLTN